MTEIIKGSSRQPYDIPQRSSETVRNSNPGKILPERSLRLRLKHIVLALGTLLAGFALTDRNPPNQDGSVQNPSPNEASADPGDAPRYDNPASEHRGASTGPGDAHGAPESPPTVDISKLTSGF